MVFLFSLDVETVRSTFFDDETRFPKGSVTFDCGLVMRDIEHEWHSEPDLVVRVRPPVFCGATPSCAFAKRAPSRPRMAGHATHLHHAIDYVEFTAKDVSDAKRFYSAAFGWKFTYYGPDYAGIQGIFLRMVRRL